MSPVNDPLEALLDHEKLTREIQAAVRRAVELRVLLRLARRRQARDQDAVGHKEALEAWDAR
jgi:hypothetical protein